MRAAFRCDASTAIGTGHVMRCLALADELRRQGAECLFLCRHLPPALRERIVVQGHAVRLLEQSGATPAISGTYADWLGVPWEIDARQSRDALRGWGAAWLVVDHYALAAPWQAVLREVAQQVMAIDDLADRAHDSDVLLDQNRADAAQDYAARVPAHCDVLGGPRFALLRPEFAAARAASLARRREPRPERLLISMGGADPANATGRVLRVLAGAAQAPRWAKVHVIVGAASPWLEEVRALAASLRCSVDVEAGTDGMAAAMAQADFSIGAAGTTSWERCCVGLPSLAVVVAENQEVVARTLATTGAAHTTRLDGLEEAVAALLSRLDAGLLTDMSARAAAVTDGLGAQRVAGRLLAKAPA